MVALPEAAAACCWAEAYSACVAARAAGDAACGARKAREELPTPCVLSIMLAAPRPPRPEAMRLNCGAMISQIYQNYKQRLRVKSEN